MKPKVTTLQNGMSVIVVPQKGVESMTLLVLCRVGSRYETKEINGASHFIEHLMFKGTKKRPNTQIISRELDRYGAAYNAYTDKDLTGYYIKMDAARTALAVDMLYDMLFHSTFDAKEMDRERGVIIEEINMYEDNPQSHIEDLLEACLFPHSTLGWNIAGPRDTIRAMSREDMIAFRDAYYIPERMTVVVAGKIVPELMPLLEKTVGTVKGKAGNDAPFVPFIPGEQLSRAPAYQDKNTEQVQLALAFYGVPMNHPNQPASVLLATILGGTMSSRLFTEIREKRGLCYSISASHQSREDIGIFSIFAGLDKQRVKQAVECMYAELEKLVENGVARDELQRAKDHLRGRTMLAFEDSATQAEWYGKQWVFQRKLQTPEERMMHIDAVKPGQIKAIATQMFHPERMALSVIGPVGQKKHVEEILHWHTKHV